MGFGFWFWIFAVTVLTLLTAWGIIHEDRVIAWERRTWKRIRSWYKRRELDWICDRLTAAGLTVTPIAQIEYRDDSCIRLINDYYGIKK